jgi:hypothetical protein
MPIGFKVPFPQDHAQQPDSNAEDVPRLVVVRLTIYSPNEAKAWEFKDWCAF